MPKHCRTYASGRYLDWNHDAEREGAQEMAEPFLPQRDAGRHPARQHRSVQEHHATGYPAGHLTALVTSPHWSARPDVPLPHTLRRQHMQQMHHRSRCRELRASLAPFAAWPRRGPGTEPGVLPPRFVVRQLDEVVAEVLEVREQLPPLWVLCLRRQVRTPFKFRWLSLRTPSKIHRLRLCVPCKMWWCAWPCANGPCRSSKRGFRLCPAQL